jgi:hypothetical protein
LFKEHKARVSEHIGKVPVEVTVSGAAKEQWKIGLDQQRSELLHKYMGL